MILYRIASKAHARDLTGTGAMLYGGRWNSKGIKMIYTSSSLSLAALETIANSSTDKFRSAFYCVEIEFPDNLKIARPEALPENWSAFPYTIGTMKIGTDFIKNGGLCLRVPSAIIQTEHNFLLNPLHEDFHKIKILDSRPLIFDQRLIKRD